MQTAKANKSGGWLRSIRAAAIVGLCVGGAAWVHLGLGIAALGAVLLADRVMEGLERGPGR